MRYLKHTLIFVLFLLTTLVVLGQKCTVIVSLDGCRWDYPDIYNTPNLNAIGKQGVKAVMQPSFPSKTFPNHYTLVTGLTPDHHGIISNNFIDQETNLRFSLSSKTVKKDPRFWHGEPIWQTAMRQGLRVGVIYWPGSDIPINLGKTPTPYPTYYHDYDNPPLLTNAQRVARLQELLNLPESERPRLILMYFEEPDHTSHQFGPTSVQTKQVVEQMDSIVGEIRHIIAQTAFPDSINLIVTADHGMTRLSEERKIDIESILNKSWYDRVWYDLPTMVFPKKGCADKIVRALQNHPHLRVWKKNDVPAYLRYGTNPNIGEVVVLPDVGWTIGSRKLRNIGTHGFDPTVQDMHVPFLAVGPDFKKMYVRTETFPNTDFYNIICHILGIIPAPNDGTNGAFDVLQ